MVFIQNSRLLYRSWPCPRRCWPICVSPTSWRRRTRRPRSWCAKWSGLRSARTHRAAKRACTCASLIWSLGEIRPSFISWIWIVFFSCSTLYCAKNNYEFGLSRISHALDGGSGSSLCADTWLHVKRCVLGLLTALAKQSIVFPTLAIQEVQLFLHTCEGCGNYKSNFINNTKFFSIPAYGLTIPAVLTVQLSEPTDEPPTIGMEARKLRSILCKLVEYE